MQRYHYESTAQLNEQLQTFLLAYNHAKRLKRLEGLTSHELVCTQWQKNPATGSQCGSYSAWRQALGASSGDVCG